MKRLGTHMTLEVPCGWGEFLEMSPNMDGTLSFRLGHAFTQPPEMILTSWSFRDLEIASEYAERANYALAQRCFYKVLYQRACMKPNYQVPVIRMHYEWGQNLITKEIVLLECIQGVY